MFINVYYIQQFPKQLCSKLLLIGTEKNESIFKLQKHFAFAHLEWIPNKKCCWFVAVAHTVRPSGLAGGRDADILLAGSRFRGSDRILLLQPRQQQLLPRRHHGVHDQLLHLHVRRDCRLLCYWWDDNETEKINFDVMVKGVFKRKKNCSNNTSRNLKTPAWKVICFLNLKWFLTTILPKQPHLFRKILLKSELV